HSSCMSARTAPTRRMTAARRPPARPAPSRLTRESYVRDRRIVGVSVRLDGASEGGFAMGATEFDDVRVEARQAIDAMVNGDPAGFKALFSDADDITMGNPLGGFGRGRDAVYEQLERAASSFRDGGVTAIETVMQSVGPELAYTVEIERTRIKVGGQDE